MKKQYKLYPNKPKTVRENHLVPAKREDGIYYDFSILDSISFREPWERKMLEDDIIKYTELHWWDSPMPTLITNSSTCYFDNPLIDYIGQVRTAFTRVFRQKSGKRMMVIVEVTKLHIERQRSRDWHSTPETEYAYDVETGYRFGDQGDEEVA